ncbi:hypothetical protein D3C87_1778770 [compost metagenome]
MPPVFRPINPPMVLSVVPTTWLLLWPWVITPLLMPTKPPALLAFDADTIPELLTLSSLPLLWFSPTSPPILRLAL